MLLRKACLVSMVCYTHKSALSSIPFHRGVREAVPGHDCFSHLELRHPVSAATLLYLCQYNFCSLPAAYRDLWRGNRCISIVISFGFYLTCFLKTLPEIHSPLHPKNCEGLSSVSLLECS